MTATMTRPRLSLRDYQEDAVAAVEAAEGEGVRRALLALPTGAGKTVIFAERIRRRGGRALVLAHRDELLEQAADKVRMAMPEARIGLVKAEHDAVDAPIVVASVQTLARPRRLARLVDAGAFDDVVVDEAHHAVAATYRDVLDGVGALDDDGPCLLGVTATADRADRIGLETIFERIVYERTLLELITAGWLVDVRGIRCQVAADFGALRTAHGEIVAAEAGAMLLDAKAPVSIARAYREHATGRTALVFTPTVAVAHAVAAAFQAADVPALAVHGGMPDDERRAARAALADGSVRVVANAMLWTEGFDEPRVDCIIVARPTKSRPLYQQMIGRGMRLYPGKDDLLVIDLVGVTERHDLVSFASLSGLPPALLDGRTLTEAIAEGERRAALIAPAPTGRVVARPVDLFGRSALAWRPAAGGLFGLAAPEGLVAIVPTTDGHYRVLRARRTDGAWSATPLAEGLDLSYAQGVAEAALRRSGGWALGDRVAGWRDEPATDRQRAALKRWGDGLTKGEASRLLLDRQLSGFAYRLARGEVPIDGGGR